MRTHFLLVIAALLSELSVSNAAPSSTGSSSGAQLMGNKHSKKHFSSPRKASAEGSLQRDMKASIFSPISSDSAPDSFEKIAHPFKSPFANQSFSEPIPTNSWLGNLFYSSADNNAPTTSDPYILRVFDKYGGNPGLSIRQPAEKIIGEYQAQNNVPETDAGYFINQQKVDLRFTTAEWKKTAPIQNVTSWDMLAANLRLQSPQNAKQFIDFPLVRGMAYVTADYHNLTPQFFSQNAIIEITAANSSNSTFSGRKFKLKFNDTPTTYFVIYVLGKDPLTLRQVDVQNLVADKPYNGIIRAAKLTEDSGCEAILDENVYVWPVGAKVDAYSDGKEAGYTIEWIPNKKDNKGVLQYAYPHHIETMDHSQVTITNLKLASSAKGSMTAVIGNKWNLAEKELSQIHWLPSNPVANEDAISDIINNLEKETSSDITQETFLDDNYFSGKALQKYALIALILNSPETKLKNQEMAKTSLKKLKDAFLPYIQNKQKDPFRYDTLYKGIVSLSGLPKAEGGTGDPNAAFGHTYYSDHHYHQGYLIVTAAIIHHLDPNWMNKDITQWTETLIRDVNNPVKGDANFAPFRMWDWFAGHSWAGGIKINGALDGRDQESIPESVNFYWGAKLWGLATQNENLVKLSNLQLAISKRTAYSYFWLKDDNKNMPSGIIKNKVVGIYFEQKADYTTYFGRYLEYIHGIQQLPMTPELGEYIKDPEFVEQEWAQRLEPALNGVQGGWKGVLLANYAIIDPSSAYAQLRNAEVDGGQSRAFSLYFAATQPGFKRITLASTRLKEAAAPEIVTGVRRINLTDTEQILPSGSTS
ncbi:unnamed protein product [Umbelopsis sp. WA50703]